MLSFSFIIPVYNRPKEVEELLFSFTKIDKPVDFEIIIIEDGSAATCENILERYQTLPTKYIYQKNAGPGNARNNAAKVAQYDYLIFLDSDVLLVKDYLKNVTDYLKEMPLDCFGGPDQDDKNFSVVQQAVDFSMTSFWTTGGIRGKKGATKNYEPRSFNLGIKRDLFHELSGFSTIHPGEDPELIIRLRKHKKVKIGLIPSAVVIHKRRISIKKFSQQLYKFGLVRPIITHWHPTFDHVTFYFPLAFTIGLMISLVCAFTGHYFLIVIYLLYGFLVFIESLIKKKKLIIALLSIYTSYIQFFSYGLGFIISYISIRIFKGNPKKKFPNLFFDQ